MPFGLNFDFGNRRREPSGQHPDDVPLDTIGTTPVVDQPAQTADGTDGTQQTEQQSSGPSTNARVTAAASPTFTGIQVPVPVPTQSGGPSLWTRFTEGLAGYIVEAGTDKVKLLAMSHQAYADIDCDSGNPELSNFLRELANNPELQRKFFDFAEDQLGTSQLIHNHGELVTDVVFRLVIPRIIARLASKLREDLKGTDQENQPLSLAQILTSLTLRIDYHLAASGGDKDKAALNILKLVIGEPDDLPIQNLVGLFRGTIYDFIVQGIVKGIEKYQEYKSTLGDGFVTNPNTLDEFAGGSSKEISHELTELLPTLGSLVIKNPAVQNRLLTLLQDNLGVQFKPEQQSWLMQQISVLGNLEDPNTRLLWTYITSQFERIFTHVLVSAAGEQPPGRDLLMAIYENLGSKLNDFFAANQTLNAEYAQILQQNQKPEENADFVAKFAPLAKDLREILGLGRAHIPMPDLPEQGNVVNQEIEDFFVNELPKLLAANFSLLNEVEDLYVHLNPSATVSQFRNQAAQQITGHVMNEGVRPFVTERLPGVAADALRKNAPKLLSLFSNFVAELAVETAATPQTVTAGPAPTAQAVDVDSIQPQIDQLSSYVEHLLQNVVNGLNSDDPRAQRVWQIIENTINGVISQVNQVDDGINQNITLEIARAFIELEAEQGAKLTTLYNSLKNRGKNPLEEESFIKQFDALSQRAMHRLGIDIDRLETPLLIKTLIKAGLDSIPEFLAKGYEQYISLKTGLLQIERRTLRAGSEIDQNTDTGYALKKLPKIVTENGLSLGKAFLQDPEMRMRLAESALEAAGVDPDSKYYGLALGLVTDQIALALNSEDPVIERAWTLIQERVQGVLELALSSLAAGNESMDPTASIYKNMSTLITGFVAESNNEEFRTLFRNLEQYKRFLIRQGIEPQSDSTFVQMVSELFGPLAKQIQKQLGFEVSDEAPITGVAGDLINWFFENKLPSYLAENYLEYIIPVYDLIQEVNNPGEPLEQMLLGATHPREAERSKQLAGFIVSKIQSLNPEEISTNAQDFINRTLPEMLEKLSQRSGVDLPADAVNRQEIQDEAGALVKGVLGAFFSATQADDPSLRALWTFVENRLTDLLARVVTNSSNSIAGGGDASLAVVNTLLDEVATLGIRDIHSKYMALKTTRDALVGLTPEDANYTVLKEQERVQRQEFEDEFKRIIGQLQQRFNLNAADLSIPEILKPLVNAALESAPALVADAYRECMSPVEAKEKYRKQLIAHFREMGIHDPADLLNHVDTLLSDLAQTLTENGIQAAARKLREFTLGADPLTSALEDNLDDTRLGRFVNVVRGEDFARFSHTYVKDAIMSIGYQIAVQYLDRAKRDEQGNDVRVQSFLSAVTNIAKVLDGFVSQGDNVNRVVNALALVDPKAREAELQAIFLPVATQILELFGVSSQQEGASANRLIIPFYDLLMPLIQEHLPGAVAGVVAEQVVPVANYMIQEGENEAYLRDSLPEFIGLADAIADFLPDFLPAFLSNTREELSGLALEGLIDLLKDVDNLDKINNYLNQNRAALIGILGEDVYIRLDHPGDIKHSKEDLRRCVEKALRDRPAGFTDEALEGLVELLDEEDRKYTGIINYLKENRAELIRILGEDLYKLLDNPEFLRLPKDALKRYVRAALIKAATGITKSIDRFEDVTSPAYKPDFLLNLSQNLLGELELHVGAIEEARKNANVNLAHQIDHGFLVAQFNDAGLLHPGIPKLEAALNARKEIKETVKEIALARKAMEKARNTEQKTSYRDKIKRLQVKMAELKKIEGESRQDFFRPLTEKLLRIAEIQLQDAPFPEAVKVSLFHKVATVILPSTFESMFEQITLKDTRYTLAMVGLTKLEDTLDEEDRVNQTMTLAQFKKNYKQILDLEKNCDLNRESYKPTGSLYDLMKDKLNREPRLNEEVVFDPFTFKYLGKGQISIRSRINAEEKAIGKDVLISDCIKEFKGISPNNNLEINKIEYQQKTLGDLIKDRLRRDPKPGDIIKIHPLTLRWIGDDRVAIKSSIIAPSDETQAQINEAVGGLVSNILKSVGPTAAHLFLNVLHIGDEAAEGAIGEAFRDKFGSVYTLKSLAQMAIESGTETLKEIGPTYKVDKEDELQKLEKEELDKLSTEAQKRVQLKDQMRRVIHKAYIEAAVTIAKKIGDWFKSAWDKAVRFVFKGHAQEVFDFMERLGNSFLYVIISKILSLTLGNLFKGTGRLLSAIVFAIWDVISINKRVEEAVQFIEMDIHENFLFKATDILLDALENPEAMAERARHIQQQEYDQIQNRRRDEEAERERIRAENERLAEQRGAFARNVIDRLPFREQADETVHTPSPLPSEDTEMVDLGDTPPQ